MLASQETQASGIQRDEHIVADLGPSQVEHVIAAELAVACARNKGDQRSTPTTKIRGTLMKRSNIQGLVVVQQLAR